MMKLSALFFLIGILSLPVALATEALPTECLQIDGHRFIVEMATTEEQQQHGLQHRKHLKADRGMVFLFPQASTKAFWMKDCDIPLDMLFFRDGHLVHFEDKAPPCYLEAKDCPIYSSGEPIDTVVELKSGTRQKMGFKTGSELKPCP